MESKRKGTTSRKQKICLAFGYAYVIGMVLFAIVSSVLSMIEFFSK